MKWKKAAEKAAKAAQPVVEEILADLRGLESSGDQLVELGEAVSADLMSGVAEGDPDRDEILAQALALGAANDSDLNRAWKALVWVARVALAAAAVAA